MNPEKPTHLPPDAGGADPVISFSADFELPNAELCAAEPTGWRNYAECLVPGGKACPHAVAFSGTTLCGHLQRAAIVELTRLRRQ